MDILGAAANLATQPVRAYLSSLLREQLRQYLDDGTQLEALGVLGSEIVLHKIELRLDALKRLVPVPPGFAITRGFVRELRIIIPWTALFSQAISVKLDTVECVLETIDSITNDGNSTYQTEQNNVTKDTSTTTSSTYTGNSSEGIGGGGGGGLPAWLQSRVTKILSNVTLSVQNLVFRYVHKSIAVVMSLRSLEIVSADPHLAWAAGFVDPEGPQKISYKVLAIKDLTISLDDSPIKNNGKSANSGSDTDDIQYSFIEEPILSRTNIIARGRIVLEPNNASDTPIDVSDETISDGALVSENKKSIFSSSSSFSFSSSSSSSSSLFEFEDDPSRESLLNAGMGYSNSLNDKRRSKEVLDPFATDVLSTFPGEMNQIFLNHTKKVAPISTIATLLHVFVDSLEFGLSARQAILLERLTRQVSFIDTEMGLVEVKKTSSAITEIQTIPEKTPSVMKDEDTGIIGWLWGSLTSSTDEEIPVQEPVEPMVTKIQESKQQQSSPSRILNRDRGGGGQVDQSLVIRPRVIIGNAHIGRISLVLYRHELKKLRESDSNSTSTTTVPMSPIQPVLKNTTLDTLKSSPSSSSSSIRVPVANMGFVSIDTIFNQSNLSNSKENTPWRRNRTQQHVPVPFLRVTCESSWVQVRILEEMFQDSTLSDIAMVVDSFIDIGSLQATPWDIHLEERQMTSRSHQRLNQAHLFDIFAANGKEDARGSSSTPSTKTSVSKRTSVLKPTHQTTTIKSQPFFVWGRPGELSLLSDSSGSYTLYRHPYFQCSLFPEIDVDIVDDINTSIDQIDSSISSYSVLPLASRVDSVKASSMGLSGLPLSTRAHFSYITHRKNLYNRYDKEMDKNDTENDNGNETKLPLCCLEVICSELTLRADAVIISGLIFFNQSLDTFRTSKSIETRIENTIKQSKQSTKTTPLFSMITKVTLSGARLFLPRSNSSTSSYLQVEFGLIRACLCQSSSFSIHSLSSLISKILMTENPAALEVALVQLYARSVIDSIDSVCPLTTDNTFSSSSLYLGRFFVSELCTAKFFEIKCQGIEQNGGLSCVFTVSSISLTPSLNVMLKWAEAFAIVISKPFTLRDDYIPLAPFTPLSVLIDEVRFFVARTSVDGIEVQFSVNQGDIALGSDDNSLVLTGGSSDTSKQLLNLSVEFAGLPPILSSLVSLKYLDPSFVLVSHSQIEAIKTAPGLFLSSSIGALSCDYENAQRFLDVCADIRVGVVGVVCLVQDTLSSVGIMNENKASLVTTSEQENNPFSSSLRQWQTALLFAIPRNICLKSLVIRPASITLSRDVSLLLPQILVDSVASNFERDSLLFSFSADTFELWHVDPKKKRSRKAFLSRAEGRFMLRDTSTGRVDLSIASSARLDVDLSLLQSFLTLRPIKIPTALVATRSSVAAIDSSSPFRLSVAVAIPNLIVSLDLSTTTQCDNESLSVIEIDLTAMSIELSDVSISLKLGGLKGKYHQGNTNNHIQLIQGFYVNPNIHSSTKEWLSALFTTSSKSTMKDLKDFTEIVLPRRTYVADSLKLILGDTEIFITPVVAAHLLAWLDTVISLVDIPNDSNDDSTNTIRTISLAKSPGLALLNAPLIDIITGKCIISVSSNCQTQNFSVLSTGFILRLIQCEIEQALDRRVLSILLNKVSIHSSNKVLVTPTDLSFSIVGNRNFSREDQERSLSSTFSIETTLPNIFVSVTLSDLLSIAAVGTSIQDAITIALSDVAMSRSVTTTNFQKNKEHFFITDRNTLLSTSLLGTTMKDFLLEASLSFKLTIPLIKIDLKSSTLQSNTSTTIVSLIVSDTFFSSYQLTSVSITQINETNISVNLKNASKSISATCSSVRILDTLSSNLLDIPETISTTVDPIITISSTSSLEHLSRQTLESTGVLPDALVLNLIAQIQPMNVTVSQPFIVSCIQELHTCIGISKPRKVQAAVLWHRLNERKGIQQICVIDNSNFLTITRLRVSSSMSLKITSRSKLDDIILCLTLGPVTLNTSITSLSDMNNFITNGTRKGFFALHDTSMNQSTLTISDATISLLQVNKTYPLLKPVTAQASALIRSFYLPLGDAVQKATSSIVASVAMSHMFASINIGSTITLLLDAPRVQLLSSFGKAFMIEMESSRNMNSQFPQSQSQSRVTDPLITQLPRGLAAQELTHSLSQLPISVSRSFDHYCTSYSLGASTLPIDALVLAGVSGAQTDFTSASIQVCDSAIWVPHSVWELSRTESPIDRFSHVSSSLYTECNDQDLKEERKTPFDIHQAWKLKGSRHGAWWGSFSWTYALPVHLVEISSSTHVSISQHTFVESQSDRRFSSCPEVPSTLCCVLERLERRCDSTSLLVKPQTTLAEIFVKDWVSVCSFQLAIASSRGSETPLSSSSPIIGLVWHETQQEFINDSNFISSHRTLSNLSDLATFCNTSSTTWRIRWLEPLLTASTPSNGPGETSSQRFSHPPYVVVGTSIASVLKFSASWSKRDKEKESFIPTVPRISSFIQAPGLQLLVSQKHYLDSSSLLYKAINKSSSSSPCLDIQCGLIVASLQESTVSSFATSTEYLALDIDMGGATQLSSRLLLLPNLGVDLLSFNTHIVKVNAKTGACSINVLPQSISSLLDLGMDFNHSSRTKNEINEIKTRGIVFENLTDIELSVCQGGIETAGTVHLKKRSTETWTWPSSDAMLPILKGRSDRSESSNVSGVRFFRISSCLSPYTWSEPVPMDEALILTRTSNIVQNEKHPFIASFSRFVWAERRIQPTLDESFNTFVDTETVCLPINTFVSDPTQTSSYNKVTLRGAVSFHNHFGVRVLIKWKQELLKGFDNNREELNNLNVSKKETISINELDTSSSSSSSSSSSFLGTIGTYFFGDTSINTSQTVLEHDHQFHTTELNGISSTTKSTASIIELSGVIELDAGESIDIACLPPGFDDARFSFQVIMSTSKSSKENIKEEDEDEISLISDFISLPENDSPYLLTLYRNSKQVNTTKTETEITGVFQVQKEQYNSSFVSFSHPYSPPEITVVSIFPWISVYSSVSRAIELLSGDFVAPLSSTKPVLLSPKSIPTEHYSIYQCQKSPSFISSMNHISPPSPSVAVITCLISLAKALSECGIQVKHFTDEKVNTEADSVSVALEIDAPLTLTQIHETNEQHLSQHTVLHTEQTEQTELCLNVSPTWHLVPLHSLYGGSSQAVLCQTSWSQSKGALLNIHPPMEIINSFDETIEISFALPGDSSRSTGNTPHGFFASIAPGETLQVFDVPLLMQGVDGITCIDAAISLANPKQCKALQNNSGISSSSRNIREKLRMTGLSLPLSVDTTSMPFVLAGEGDWSIPLIVKATFVSASVGSPCLRWTITPRLVLRSQTTSPLLWCHPNLSRLLDTTTSTYSTISYLCVPTVSVLNMVDEPVTAINLSLAGSSLGIICIRLGDPNNNPNLSSKQSFSMLPSVPSHLTNFGKDFQALRNLLACPSIPADYAVRIPLLSGNNRSLQGLLLVRVILDEKTGVTNVIFLDDPQPPLRFINSNTTASMKIRLAHSPKLFPEHKLAFQLALCSPLEAVEVLGRMAQEEEALIRARLSDAADKSEGNSLHGSSSGSNRDDDGGGSSGSSGVASDLISYGSELALAHAKVALEQVTNNVDEWARAAKNNAPTALSEHLMWSSQFDTDPSYAVVVGAGESAAFDWSLMVDVGLRNAFIERPFLIPWTPAIPLVWSSSQQNNSSYSSSYHSSQASPQIDLEDLSSPQKDGGKKFRMVSSMWRKACATASLIPSRVFEGDTPIQHVLPKLQIQEIPERTLNNETDDPSSCIETDFFIEKNLVFKSYNNQSSLMLSTSSSSSSSSSSSILFCELLDGTLTIYLDKNEEENGGLLESSLHFQKSIVKGLYTLRIDRVSISLLSPETIPVAIPRSHSIADSSWWIPMVPETTLSSTLSSLSSVSAAFPSTSSSHFMTTKKLSSAMVTNPPYALSRHRQLLVLHMFGLSLACLVKSTNKNQTNCSIFTGIEHIQLDDHQNPSVAGSEATINDVGSPLRFTVIAMLSKQEEGSIYERNYALSARLETSILQRIKNNIGLSTLTMSSGLLRLQLSDTVVDEIIEAYKGWVPLLISKTEILLTVLSSILNSKEQEENDNDNDKEEEKGGLKTGLQNNEKGGLKTGLQNNEDDHVKKSLFPLTMFSVGQLRIGNIAVEVSLCASKPGSGPLFIAVDRMPLAFSAIQLTNVISTPEALFRAIVASYIVDTLLRSPALVGSLDLLGNPTNLSRSIAAGLYDVFALPLKGGVSGRGNVLDVLKGIGLGWASLAGHVAEGTLHSIAGLSVSLSRNINRLVARHNLSKESITNGSVASIDKSSNSGNSPRRLVKGREQNVSTSPLKSMQVFTTKPLSPSGTINKSLSLSISSSSVSSIDTHTTPPRPIQIDSSLVQEENTEIQTNYIETTTTDTEEKKPTLNRQFVWHTQKPIQQVDEDLTLFLYDDSQAGGISFINSTFSRQEAMYIFRAVGGNKLNTTSSSRLSLLSPMNTRSLSSISMNSSALVAGIRPSLADGIEGLGRGLLGAVSDLASLSLQAISSEPGRGTGTVIAGVGRGLASAITKPVAGALELIAHASTAAMLAVQYTPRVEHVSPIEWIQITPSFSPPRPVIQKVILLLGEESLDSLCLIPCNIRFPTLERNVPITDDDKSSFEQVWAVGCLNTHQFFFIRHGGIGTHAFSIINVSPRSTSSTTSSTASSTASRLLPDILKASTNVVLVKEVGNKAHLRSAQKGESISTTTVSFCITLQKEKEEQESTTTTTTSSSSSLVMSQPSTPIKQSNSLMKSTPITEKSGFTLNFFSTSPIAILPTVATNSPSSSSSSSSTSTFSLSQKVQEKVEILVVLPAEQRFAFSKMIGKTI